MNLEQKLSEGHTTLKILRAWIKPMNFRELLLIAEDCDHILLDEYKDPEKLEVNILFLRQFRKIITTQASHQLREVMKK